MVASTEELRASKKRVAEAGSTPQRIIHMTPPQTIGRNANNTTNVVLFMGSLSLLLS